MKKIIYSLISGIVMLCFAACDPQEIDDHSLGGQLVSQSDISISVAATGNPNEYTFTNTSKELPSDVQLFWSLGDGKVTAAAHGASITKQYKKSGSYTVSLLAFTKAGQTTVSQTVNVTEDLQGFGWPGFDYDSSANLFKTATFTNEFYYADANWSQYANPAHTATGNQKLDLVFDKATALQWQNQVHFVTNIAVSSGKSYDFSVAFKANNDIPAATVKVSKVGDDGTYFFLADHNVSIMADEMKVVGGSALAGFDGNVKITFDFGGSPANTNLSIYNITLTEHNEANVAPLDYDSDGNLWKAVDKNKDYTMSFWWADANWSQVGNPDFEQNNNVYTITAKSSAAAEWQAQNSFNTNSLALGADDLVDFSCIVMATKDSPAIIKLSSQESDGNYLFEKHGIQFKAGEIKVIKFTNQKLSGGASAKLKLIFDFGGCQDGTEFTIGNITLIKK